MIQFFKPILVSFSTNEFLPAFKRPERADIRKPRSQEPLEEATKAWEQIEKINQSPERRAFII